jgi:hypothetical protein
MAQRVSIKSILDAICGDVKKAIQAMYVDRAGLLKNSDLVKSVEVKNQRNVLTVYANDYVKYIESGRKKFTKKVPISALLIFIRKRKIRSDKGMSRNQLAYAIQHAIFINGITPKRGLNKRLEKITLDMMFKSLDQYFKLKINKAGEIEVGNRR